MERESLQLAIKETLVFTEKYDAMQREAKEVIYMYEATYVKRMLLIFLGIGIYWVVNDFQLSVGTVFLGALLGTSIGIPIYMIYRIWTWKKRRDSIKLSNALNEEAENYLEMNLKNALLPQIFCNTHALNRFTFYMDNYIADNLKECANLFHRESEDEKIQREINTLKSKVDASIQASLYAAEEASAARSAANDAESAAYDAEMAARR